MGVSFFEDRPAKKNTRGFLVGFPLKPPKKGTPAKTPIYSKKQGLSTASSGLVPRLSDEPGYTQ